MGAFAERRRDLGVGRRGEEKNHDPGGEGGARDRRRAARRRPCPAARNPAAQACGLDRCSAFNAEAPSRQAATTSNSGTRRRNWTTPSGTIWMVVADNDGYRCRSSLARCIVEYARRKPDFKGPPSTARSSKMVKLPSALAMRWFSLIVAWQRSLGTAQIRDAFAVVAQPHPHLERHEFEIPARPGGPAVTHRVCSAFL